MTTTRHTPLIYVTVRDIHGNEERLIETTERIARLEYTDSLKQADKLELTVDNDDLSSFDDPIWSHGNFVRVTWGYPGNMAIAREMVITKVKGFRELKIEARAKSVLIDAVKKSRTWKNMTRSEIARKIAEEYGYDTSTMQVDDSGRRIPHITQAGLSDAQFLKKLAHQQGDEFYVDHEGFHFHELRLRQVPLREFIWFSDPGRGDVIDVVAELDVTRKKAEVHKKSKDPVTKKVEEHKASNQDTKRDGLGVVTLDPTNDLKGAKYTFKQKEIAANASDVQIRPDFSFANDPMSSRSKYLYRPIERGLNMCVNDGPKEAEKKYKSDAMGAVKVTLTAVGDPSMLAKTLVLLSNVGKRLSGSYYVTEVQHSVEKGNYKMKLKMRSDGLGEAAKKTQAFSDGIPDVVHEKSKAKTPDPAECATPPTPEYLLRNYSEVTPKGARDPRPGYVFNDNEALDARPVSNPAGEQVATYYKERPKICDAPTTQTERVVQLTPNNDLKSASYVDKTRVVVVERQAPKPEEKPVTNDAVQRLLDAAEKANQEDKGAAPKAAPPKTASPQDLLALALESE